MLKRWLLLLITACLSTLCVNAVILYDESNTATTTDPGTGVPFGNVVGIYNASGTLVGSGVYLENGYFITANHVSVAAGYTFSFDGTTFYGIDTTAYTPTQVASTDIKIFYSSASVLDSLASVNILSSTINLTQYYMRNHEYPEAVVVGAGAGRSSTSALGSGTVTWGGVSTYDIRWGTNALEYLQTVTVGTLSYQAYISVNQDADTRNSTGSTEAAMALADSGGGIFYYDETAQEWYLIAIATAVSVNGTSYYYDSGTTDQNSSLNIYLALASYADEISAITSVVIPEPSVAASALGLGALGLVFVRRRRG